MTQYLWTPERDHWLRANAKNLTIKEIQSHLRLGKDIIKNRCKKLGVKWKHSPRSGRPVSWTSEEDKILCNGIKSNYTYNKIAKTLGRSPCNCQKRYLHLQGQIKSKLTMQQILGMDLIEGQKQMAISLFERNPSWAENYIRTINKYRHEK